MEDSFRQWYSSFLLIVGENLIADFEFTVGQRYYKPWATRTLVLLLLLLVTSILIFLAELACRSIPAHSGYGEFGDLANNTLRLNARNILNGTQPSKAFKSRITKKPASSSLRRGCQRFSDET